MTAFAMSSAVVVAGATNGAGNGSRKHTAARSPMRFRPCIDLHDGKVKQIVGSTLEARGVDDESSSSSLLTNFESDKEPSSFAELYCSDGLSGGHIIMLGPGNQAAGLQALSGFPGGMQIGGGINPDNAGLYLSAGASHVVVTSYVFNEGQVDYERAGRLRDAVGKERLVLDLSCREREGQYFVCTDRWSKWTEVGVTPENLERLAEYCDEFLVHAVDVEGKRGGVDLKLIKILADQSPIQATYAGGVRTLADMDLAREAGGGKVDVTIGSALDIFGGSLPYADAVAWQRSQKS